MQRPYQIDSTPIVVSSSSFRNQFFFDYRLVDETHKSIVNVVLRANAQIRLRLPLLKVEQTNSGMPQIDGVRDGVNLAVA
jgi:hypothetical protein